MRGFFVAFIVFIAVTVHADNIFSYYGNKLIEDGVVTLTKSVLASVYDNVGTDFTSLAKVGAEMIVNILAADGKITDNPPKKELEEMVRKYVEAEYLKRVKENEAKMNWTSYDFHLNVSSLLDVGNKGWPITLANNKTIHDFGNTTSCLVKVDASTSSESAADPFLNQELHQKPGILPESDQYGCIVSFLGFFNTGKTYVINKLFGKSFPMGRTIDGVTKGINAAIFDNFFVVDSEGARRTVAEDALQDRISTDAFNQKLTLKISHLIVFQVGTIFSSDVKMIKSLYLQAKEINKQLKNFVVMHNFLDLFHLNDTEHHIHSDIEVAFGAQKIVYGSLPTGEQCYAWSKDEIVHLVMGKEGTEAGDKYNACALHILRNFIATTKTSVTRPVDFICTITTEATTLLPGYFYHPKYNQNDYNGIPVVVSPSVSKPFSTAKETQYERFTRIINPFNWAKSTKKDEFAWLPDNNNVNCEQFFKFPPLGFLVVLKETRYKNGTITYSISMNESTSLQYLPLDEDSESGTPSVAFTPYYDVIMTKDGKWGVIMDVIDSSFRVDFRDQKLAVRGCRPVHEHSRINNGAQTVRKYSMFEIIIPCPKGMSCSSEFKNHSPVLQNGVLKILFDLPKDDFDEF